MSRTYRLPSGNTVRTQSNRAHVLIQDDVASGRAAVVKRSDSVATLLADRRRRGFHTDVRYYIGNRATGELVLVNEFGGMVKVDA
jgi:hypothetical protein